MRHKYSLLVGYFGEVHQGNDLKKAMALYALYVEKSMNNEGRASGEAVKLFDGETIIHEHLGTQEN